MADYLSQILNQYRPQKTMKRVFISFHMDDLYAKNLLVEQAKSDKFDLEFVNYAINEPFETKWKTQCEERINQTSVTICLIGKQTYSRGAVIWELEKSYELGKAVIGILIHRGIQVYCPLPIFQHKSPVYYWHIPTIVSVLNSI